jgi:hypothetical protein
MFPSRSMAASSLLLPICQVDAALSPHSCTLIPFSASQARGHNNSSTALFIVYNLFFIRRTSDFPAVLNRKQNLRWSSVIRVCVYPTYVLFVWWFETEFTCSTGSEWWVCDSWWNEKWLGKPRYFEKTCPQCHFFHHRCHMTWPMIELGHPRWEAGA